MNPGKTVKVHQIEPVDLEADAPAELSAADRETLNADQPVLVPVDAK